MSASAGREARNQCQTLMHEESISFRNCVDQMLATMPSGTRRERMARLGVSYYAWIASAAAAKNGLPTAEESARYFLQVFRPMQRQLGVQDRSLCATVPGDCAVRLERLRLMESVTPRSGALR